MNTCRMHYFFWDLISCRISRARHVRRSEKQQPYRHDCSTSSHIDKTTEFDTRMAQSTDHVFGEQYVGRRERRSMQRESPVCLTIGMRRNMVEKERERRGKTSPYLNLLDSVQRMEAGHSSRQSLQTDETRTDVRC
ncbi:uncharacterized protein [Mycetomoellerius zeteki]|uniref:uncharacterized protein isoform X3 n=1 Tax=Mycetomoellerius zeteki TaxID=64791 RepID=UPI00084E956A|nr:PREDICTED: uncharacterized protein LOC108730879 isoform X3 [Trachymyrmex zeteki]